MYDSVIHQYLQQGFLNTEKSEYLKKLLLDIVNHPIL